MEIKVKAYINRVKIDCSAEFSKAVDYFKKHGVNLVFDFEFSDLKKLKSITRELTAGKTRTLLTPVANSFPQNNYDITMFVFDGAEFFPNIPTGYCYFPFNPPKPFIDISTHVNNPKDYSFVEICHELMHSLVFFANQKGFVVRDVMDTYRDNWNPDSPTGNFTEQWKLLEPYLKKKYVYFSDTELAKWKLKDELWEFLDKARGLSGIPFIITSGLRTPAQNLAVGGKPNSAHLRGLACDLLCTDNFKRYAMLRGILGVGKFVFIEVATKHIHIDLDSSIHQMSQTILELNDE